MTSAKTGFGIDFGTTNSVIAAADSSTGRARAFTDDEGRPHPSIVWYHGAEVTVGREAKLNIKRFSEEGLHYFAPSIKRHLGTDKSFNIFSVQRSAIEIASEIFQFLCDHAKISRMIDIEEAVVAVPVYFNGKQRRELRQAAEDAGIYITTFIHEPFAAIAGYCFGELHSESLDQLNKNQILVFDWGGGTLDITIVSIRAGNLSELAITGLNDRAGDQFDERLMNAILTRFLKHNGFNISDLTKASSTSDRFLAECERAKISLSNKDTEKIRVAQAFQIDGSPYDIDETITRQDFEDLIRRDVQAALHEVDKALDQAKLTGQEINQVLLIGGSSKIPMLRNAMLDRFGHRIVTVPNADTIIAEGTAFVAAKKIMPVLAETIGVQLSDGSNYRIFEEGSIAKPEVCSNQVNMFCTDPRDGQARLVITEETSSDFKTKDNLAIPVSKELRKYNNERVTIDFKLDNDLILHVSGKGATMKDHVSIELHDIRFGLNTM